MLCVENGLDQYRSEFACDSRNSVASTAIASREYFSREDEGNCIWPCSVLVKIVSIQRFSDMGSACLS